MRTFTNLITPGTYVYVHFKDKDLCRQFLQQAEWEGVHNWRGRKAYGHRTDGCPCHSAGKETLPSWVGKPYGISCEPQECEESGIREVHKRGTEVRVFITDLQKDGRTYSFRAFLACDTSEKRNLKGNRLWKLLTQKNELPVHLHSPVEGVK